MNNLSAKILSFCKILEPQDELTVTQWSMKHRELVGRGKFRPFPYQREIMDTATDGRTRETTLVSAGQIGKTTVIENIIGYFIAHKPKLILAVFPKVDMGEAWSQGRLQTMADESFPDLISPKRGRDAANTKLYKEYPGGNIAIVGANSAAGLRMRDRQIALMDDINGYEDSAGEEGDVELLVKKRTESYPDAFIFATSTPTFKRTILDPTGQPVTLPSRIYRRYYRSDQRRWYCKCPRCEQWATLTFDCVRWPTDKPQDAIYQPLCCKAELADSDRLKMAMGGEWRATADFSGHAGFYLHGLASPFPPHLGYVSRMHEMVREWLDAQQESEKLKVVVNTWFGEDFELRGERPDVKPLFDRVERFGPEGIPAAVQYITAGCDVQHDRLELSVIGWGFAEESWVIEHRIIVGDVTDAATWSQLDEAARVVYPRADGKQIGISCMLVDSGDGKTQDQVYKFCASRQARRIYASKGSTESGAPLTRQARPTKYAKRRDNIFLVTIGTHVAKGTLFTRLKTKVPGRCYIHFSDTLTTDYFNQLAGEELQVRKKMGKNVEVWVQLGRNEALDCFVMAIAAYAVLRPQIKQEAAPAGPAKSVEAEPAESPEVPIIQLLSGSQSPMVRRTLRQPSRFKF